MSRYSEKALPFLNAIAAEVFNSTCFRGWLIEGTPHEHAYTASTVLFDEQKNKRFQKKSMSQPFWANYWCGLDSRCVCHPSGSKAIESDAIFFFRNAQCRVLAVHVEFKHAKEAFGFGQPESYPLRAACFARTCHTRPTLNEHHDWTTVLFCGSDGINDPRISSFDRVITHAEAAKRVPGYPVSLQHQT